MRARDLRVLDGERRHTPEGVEHIHREVKVPGAVVHLGVARRVLHKVNVLLRPDLVTGRVRVQG